MFSWLSYFQEGWYLALCLEPLDKLYPIATFFIFAYIDVIWWLFVLFSLQFLSGQMGEIKQHQLKWLDSLSVLQSNFMDLTEAQHVIHLG